MLRSSDDVFRPMAAANVQAERLKGGGAFF